MFTAASTGTCNAVIEEGIKISGEFTLSANIASEDHDFIGIIEQGPHQRRTIEGNCR